MSSMSLDDELGRYYDDFIKEFDSFQERIQLQAKTLRQNK